MRSFSFIFLFIFSILILVSIAYAGTLGYCIPDRKYSETCPSPTTDGGKGCFYYLKDSEQICPQQPFNRCTYNGQDFNKPNCGTYYCNGDKSCIKNAECTSSGWQCNEDCQSCLYGCDQDTGKCRTAPPQCDSSTCTTWYNQGCGVSPCASNQMKQTRTCGDPDCDTSRCVSDPACGGGGGGCGDGVCDALHEGCSCPQDCGPCCICDVITKIGCGRWRCPKDKMLIEISCRPPGCGSTQYQCVEDLQCFNYNMEIVPKSTNLTYGETIYPTVFVNLTSGTSTRVNLSIASVPNEIFTRKNLINLTPTSCEPNCTSTLTISYNPIHCKPDELCLKKCSDKCELACSNSTSLICRDLCRLRVCRDSLCEGNENTCLSLSNWSDCLNYTKTSCDGSICVTENICRWDSGALDESRRYYIKVSGVGGDPVKRSAEFRFNVINPLPDLIITEIGYDSNRDVIWYKIKNNGSAVADSSTSQLWVEGRRKALDDVDPLDVGETRVENFTYDWGCSYPSDIIEVCANYDHRVLEKNHSNNCASRGIDCSSFGFKLSAHPPNGTVRVGQSINTTVVADLTSIWRRRDGFTPIEIQFKCYDDYDLHRKGIKCLFDPQTCNLGPQMPSQCNSTLTLTTNLSTPLGTYRIVIEGSSNRFKREATVYNLTVRGAYCGDNFCDFGETQDNCPSDCKTIVIINPAYTYPRQNVTLIVYFNDSRFDTSEIRYGFNLTIDAKVNLTIDGQVWNSTDCPINNKRWRKDMNCNIGGQGMQGTSDWCNCQGGNCNGMHNGRSFTIKTSMGYGYIETTCRIPSGLAIGTHNLTAVPTIFLEK